jgi:hypothetical protein
MFKRMILALTVATAMMATTGLAQENATLVLRNGDRISGQLIDLGGVGFTFRVNGQDRNIPTGEVAVIDFAGGDVNDFDWNRINSGQHVALLRNGRAVEGSLYDIGGTSPLRITFRTGSGERDFSSSEISRIVLGRPSNAPSGTSGSPVTLPGGAGIAVQGNQQWTPTGITVRRGEMLQLNSTGEVQLSADSADVASPFGAKSQRLAPGAPMPTTYAGALIGRIGNGRPFAIGGLTSLQAPAAGQLFLGINDDNVGDNQGGFRVEISRTTNRR